MALPLLGLLAALPSLFSAGAEVISAVTGEEPPAQALGSPEAMAAHIENLPPDQQAEIQRRFYEHAEKLDRNSTERWAARMQMETAADVEKLRSSARPKIALQAMGVIRTFAFVLIWAMVALSIEWLTRAGFAAFGCRESVGPDGLLVEICRTMPSELSVGYMLAQLEPVVNMIWPPLLASLAACVAVIKAYMGARERDKARADEMRHGKPLDSTAATIAAAGGGVAGIIRAFKGAR